MILKIQRPLSTNEPVPLALVYNKRRSVQAFIPFSLVAKQFRNGEAKFYFEGAIEGDDLRIVRRVAEQSW